MLKALIISMMLMPLIASAATIYDVSMEWNSPEMREDNTLIDADVTMMYEVCLMLEFDGECDLVSVTSDNSHIFFNVLEIDTPTVYVKVRAVDKYGTSAWSNIEEKTPFTEEQLINLYAYLWRIWYSYYLYMQGDGSW